MSGLQRRVVVGWLEAIAAIVRMHGVYWDDADEFKANDAVDEAQQLDANVPDEHERAPGYGTVPTLRVILRLVWSGIRTNDARIQSAALRIVREAYRYVCCRHEADWTEVCRLSSHALKSSTANGIKAQPGNTAMLLRIVRASMDPRSKIRRVGPQDSEAQEKWNDEWCSLLESTLEDVEDRADLERERLRRAPQM